MVAAYEALPPHKQELLHQLVGLHCKPAERHHAVAHPTVTHPAVIQVLSAQVDGSQRSVEGLFINPTYTTALRGTDEASTHLTAAESEALLAELAVHCAQVTVAPHLVLPHHSILVCVRLHSFWFANGREFCGRDSLSSCSVSDGRWAPCCFGITGRSGTVRPLERWHLPRQSRDASCFEQV